jgi:hypothetical protein
MEESRLENIKSYVESLSKRQHLDVLRIIRETSSARINENRSGIYINISYLPPETLAKIETYIEYVKDQERSLEGFEAQKEEFKSFFKG